MEASSPTTFLIRGLTSTEKRRKITTVLLWAVGIATAYTQALLQRTYLTPLDQALVFTICLLASAVIIDIGDAVVGYMMAMGLAVGIMFLVATVPISLWSINPASSITLSTVWLAILFHSIFPIPSILYFVATILGAALGEKFL